MNWRNEFQQNYLVLENNKHKAGMLSSKATQIKAIFLEFIFTNSNLVKSDNLIRRSFLNKLFSLRKKTKE